MFLAICFLPAQAQTPPYKVAVEADDVVTRVLFDAVASEFRLDIEYVYYPSFDAILKSVKTGNSDFAANVTYTPDRALYFDFSGPTNIEYTYVYSLDNATLDKLYTVGVPKGTIYRELIEAAFPSMTLVEYSGQEEAMQLLQSGTVDGVVDAINQLKPMLLAGFDAQLLNHQISIKPVSIVSTKGRNTQLLRTIEHYIHGAEVQKLLRESIRQYQFEIRQQALRQAVLNSGINFNRPLRVKIENIGQYATYHSDGSMTGITADIVLQACDILMLNCQLESTADESWESMYGDLLAKRIDVLSPIAISEARKDLVYYSDPYYRPEAILVKREGYKDNVYSNVSELIIERIGVVKDDYYEELLRGLLPKKALLTYDSSESQLQALINHEVDYIAISRANFNILLRESKDLLPLTEDPLIGGYYTSDIAIGFAKNQVGESLAPLFSRALKMIDTERIVKRYDYRPDWKATLQAEQRFSRQSRALFMLVLGFLAIVAIYLHSQSNTDNLTRLNNRRAMHRRFRSGINANYTLLYLDINRFKFINDTYGHEIGDQVLRALAGKIELYWKGYGYRIGGDEFILVGQLDSVTLNSLLGKLSKIHFVSEDHQVSLDISIAIGVSYPRERFMALQEVLNEADQAMYDHKRKKHHSMINHQSDEQNVVPLTKGG
ncbi:GGDEF domain-containing protein [Vibrio coralliilyticus]|uniref:GGDEF domain-containing protein n=1 Tax=unclassified Vibrio TaxID=2614977 RepID=UPI0020762C18|nr:MULTISPECIES: GGDEF domain-containing protein [Vibrio]USD34071.1 transporter substrate-binding domain-containing protein [Vibrio sp. SCSIO 43186]USD47141.1 transporter substrate-binding domain-containing protein [Vibrio sp. SCSIO 43145]USD71195.1 transporter substrate-binding domain-containing protein [Vibrio sp. SCSIO 43139]USD97480.1 GGDEF domain-containing protein [Vibrio coralliilyticus]